MHNSIIIKGAREHNLKNIDVTLPRDQLVVITGLSGSGKVRALRRRLVSDRELVLRNVPPAYAVRLRTPAA